MENSIFCGKNMGYRLYFNSKQFSNNDVANILSKISNKEFVDNQIKLLE